MKFKHFLGNILNIQNRAPDDKPLLLRISTMTVMGGRRGAATPLETFKTFFRETKGGWTMTEKSFNNSVTVFKKVDATKKRSVKFFPNGLIHVTGCATPMEGQDILKEIQILVDPLFEGITEFNIIDMETQMINATFKVPHLIDQLALIDLYERYKKYVSQVSLNPETYSAVKARMFNLSVSVFKTGSIVLSGAKRLEDLVRAYDFLLKILYDPSIMGKPAKIKEKEPEHFYQTETFMNKIRDFYVK